MRYPLYIEDSLVTISTVTQQRRYLVTVGNTSISGKKLINCFIDILLFQKIFYCQAIRTIGLRFLYQHGFVALQT